VHKLSPLVYIFSVQVVSSPAGSSGASSDSSGSNMETLRNIPFRSTSDTDLASAADSALNTSHHSEPESLKQVSGVLETEFVESLFNHKEYLWV
jgi:hypothetical protein